LKRRLLAVAHSTFSSLNVRNFRLFFIGQLISQIGSWLTMIALTLLILHRTNSGIAVGGLVACQFGPVLVLGAWGGLIADRSDKRHLLMATQTLEMLQSFALAALAFMHQAPLAAFYVTALAGGIMLAFDNPARRSFVPETVPDSNLQNAVSLNSALMTSSRVFGPALAGLLVVTTGYAWCFAIDAVSYLGVLVALQMMRPDELRRPPVTTRAKGQVRAGLRYARSIPELWVPLTMMAVVGTLTFNFSVVLPLFVERTFHGSDGTYTLMYSVLSLGALIGALGVAARRSIEVSQLVTACGLFGVAMLVFAAAPTLAAAFPIALLVGLTSIAFMTFSTAIMQMRAEPAMRGRVLALQAIVFIGSTPIGGPLLGAICDAYGARAGLVVGGVAAIGAATWGYVHGRRARVGPGRLPAGAALVAPDMEVV
jgi:MFS family permease